MAAESRRRTRRNLRKVVGGAQVGKAPLLDPVIHERIRLGITSALAANDSRS